MRESAMAKLSDSDMRAIFGQDYTPPVVSEATLAEQKATSRASMRNTAIGIAVLVVVILIAIFFRS
jgi:hypothetical protein